MENNNKKVVIIGGGIGGLGTAILLAKKGYDVSIYEKNKNIGGRANIFETQVEGVGKFVFDMGPSWYLMPDVFEHFFNSIGENVKDYLDLKKLSPSYRIFFKEEKNEKGEQLIVDMHSNLEIDLKTFEKIEAGSDLKLKDYLEKSKYQYEIAKNGFMYKNYNSLFDFLNLRVMTEGPKLHIFSKMHNYVTKFFKSEILQKIMEYQLVFLGSSPYNTPALYNIMNHIDFDMGVYYPQGGIYQIISGLEKIALKNNVKIYTEKPIQKILTKDKKTVGVLLADNQEVKADIVVSNADMHFTETTLLDNKDRTYFKKYWDKKTLAPSAFIIYLGVKGKIDSLVHHSLLFSKNWKNNFEEIFDKPRLPSDPSFYICCPSKTDSSVAPEGYENLFILVPIASNLEITQEEKISYRNKIISEIEKEMNIPDLNNRIVFERIYSVDDFKNDYNAQNGTALGLAHTMNQTAIFRPNNFSKKVKNLYYVGAGTNPGIGMPICLISAELAYKRIEKINDPSPMQPIVPSSEEEK
jgi:phytoene desaturase